MHNFSYLGGLVGIIMGGVAVFWQRHRLNTSSSNVNTNADATEPSGEREPPMTRDVKS
jgi:hypothetical protein